MEKRKHTEEEQEILHRLKRLHESRKPLNIHAAKRRFPELIEAVYAMDPFWGWKNALADAGIDYAAINVELDEWVTCRICGRNFAYLGTHMRCAHEMSLRDYRAEYPGEPIMSEVLLAGRLGRGRRDPELPHWEPLWSREYILDRAYTYFEMGKPLNARSVSKYDYPLLTAARNTFGAWGDVLTRIGLDPSTVHVQRPNRNLDKAGILAEVRRRYREGLPINSQTLQIEDPGLFVYLRKVFGSHRAGIAAAGIPPDEIRISPALHTEAERDRMREEAKRIAACDEGSRRKQLRGFKDAYFPTMYSFYNNWTEVAGALGIPPHRLQIYPTERDLFNSAAYWSGESGCISESALLEADPEMHDLICRRYNDFEEFRERYRTLRAAPRPPRE